MTVTMPSILRKSQWQSRRLRKRLLRVCESISTPALKHRCKSSTEEIVAYALGRPKAQQLVHDGMSNLVHIDRGSSVLAVAHMDFVWQEQFFTSVLRKGQPAYWFSPQLDDRIGVYTFLDLFPKMNINVDVLLTDNEERGASTAMMFNPDTIGKKYNWIVSFDRAGSDAVTYGKDSPEWLAALASAGFQSGWGSYSCIVSLDLMHVCGVNIGTGLEGGHGPSSLVHVDTYASNVARFIRFYRQHAETLFVAQERAKRYSFSRSAYGRGDWLDMAFGEDEDPCEGNVSRPTPGNSPPHTCMADMDEATTDAEFYELMRSRGVRDDRFRDDRFSGGRGHG